MTLIDWLMMYSLPNEPISFDEALECVLRKYEQLCEDADYLFWSIAKYPAEVMWIGARLGTLNGMFPPDSMSWPDWIESLAMLNGETRPKAHRGNEIIVVDVLETVTKEKESKLW